MLWIRHEEDGAALNRVKCKTNPTEKYFRDALLQVMTHQPELLDGNLESLFKTNWTYCVTQFISWLNNNVGDIKTVGKWNPHVLIGQNRAEHRMS
jgi:hypothetical protein